MYISIHFESRMLHSKWPLLNEVTRGKLMPMLCLKDSASHACHALQTSHPPFPYIASPICLRNVTHFWAGFLYGNFSLLDFWGVRHLPLGHVASAHRRHAKGHPDEVVLKRSRGKFRHVVHECIWLLKVKFIFEWIIFCLLKFYMLIPKIFRKNLAKFVWTSHNVYIQIWNGKIIFLTSKGCDIFDRGM